MRTIGFSPWSADPKPFNAIFEKERNLLIHSMEGCDAIVLWGGTDIPPSFYNQEKHHMTWHHENSQRDKLEWEWLHEAIERDIPIIGVCRGAQMLCAAAGGTLFQHVTGHQGSHPIETEDGRVYQSSSAHHQMLNLQSLPEQAYELLAWSKVNLSKKYEDDTGEVAVPAGFKEPEVVYFPNIKGLAIQGHPEWHTIQDPFNQYVFELVERMFASIKETV